MLCSLLVDVGFGNAGFGEWGEEGSVNVYGVRRFGVKSPWDVKISDGIPREGRLPRQWASTYLSTN